MYSRDVIVPTRWAALFAVALCSLSLFTPACARRRTTASSAPRGVVASAYPRAQCFPVCSPGFTCERGICVHPCNPICNPGWACSDGSCLPLCNPPCAAGFHCSEQRTCEPGPPRPSRMAEPTQEWLPAPPEPSGVASDADGGVSSTTPTGSMRR